MNTLIRFWTFRFRRRRGPFQTDCSYFYTLCFALPRDRRLAWLASWTVLLHFFQLPRPSRREYVSTSSCFCGYGPDMAERDRGKWTSRTMSAPTAANCKASACTVTAKVNVTRAWCYNITRRNIFLIDSIFAWLSTVMKAGQALLRSPLQYSRWVEGSLWPCAWHGNSNRFRDRFQVARLPALCSFRTERTAVE